MAKRQIGNTVFDEDTEGIEIESSCNSIGAVVQALPFFAKLTRFYFSHGTTIETVRLLCDFLPSSALCLLLICFSDVKQSLLIRKTLPFCDTLRMFAFDYSGDVDYNDVTAMFPIANMC